MLFRGKCSFKALILEKHNEQLDAYNDVYHSYFHVWSEIGLIFGLAMIWDRKSVGFQHLQSQPSPPLATKKPSKNERRFQVWSVELLAIQNLFRRKWIKHTADDQFSRTCSNNNYHEILDCWWFWHNSLQVQETPCDSWFLMCFVYGLNDWTCHPMVFSLRSGKSKKNQPLAKKTWRFWAIFSGHESSSWGIKEGGHTWCLQEGKHWVMDEARGLHVRCPSWWKTGIRVSSLTHLWGGFQRGMVKRKKNGGLFAGVWGW